MTNHKEFSNSVREKLEYYVYLLLDPITDEIFYVGKGKGNRVFAHVNAALTDAVASDKLDRIRQVLSLGQNVKYIIHRHGLSGDAAYEVEAALIDFIGMEDLTNEVQGHNSDDRGRMTVDEIIAKYNAKPAEIIEPAILVTINRRYKRNMGADELYEATHGDWVIGSNKEKAKYAFAVANGIIRAVYAIQKWKPIVTDNINQKQNKRWQFEGAIAENMRHYVGQNTEKYATIGAQNPIRYVNCS